MDLTKLQEQFNKVLQYSQENQNLSDIKTDSIFSEWKQNKEWFLSTVGSPIYEYDEPVCFELDENSRRVEVDRFLEWIAENYSGEMYKFFLDNYDGIFENKIPKVYEEFSAGTKLSKVLMKKFGLQAEDVRQRLSMLIQSNKITGKLCFSVHPLDFLSASENNYNWRSCHALDGEYRVGNVSYMLDDCTFIVYLKGNNENAKLPHFPEDVPWNDKKWRCYFYIDRENDMVYAAKQYPFFSEKALEIIADILRLKLGYFWPKEKKDSLIKKSSSRSWFHNTTFRDWEDFADTCLLPCKFKPNGLKGEVFINGYYWTFQNTKVIVGYGSQCKVVPITNYIETDKDACCYNDVIQSHTYAPWILVYGLDQDGIMPIKVEKKLIVGKGVPCLCCGNRYTADSDIFVCNMCREDEHECARCGCVDYGDRMHYDPSDMTWLCHDCWSDLNN